MRQGKGLKERTVPLSRLARAALGDYFAERPSFNTQRLFFSQAGKPLASRDVQRMVSAAHFAPYLCHPRLAPGESGFGHLIPWVTRI